MVVQNAIIVIVKEVMEPPFVRQNFHENLGYAMAALNAIMV